MVTSWDLALHPVETVYAGTLAVALPDARAALATVLEDLAPRTPTGLTWVAVMATLPAAAPVPEALRGVPSLLLNLVSLDPAAGPGLVEPWRRALPVSMDAVDHVPFVSYQRSADASAPEGCGWDVRSEWLSGLDGRTAEVMVDAAEAARNPLYEVLVRPLGGRAAEIPADATPFSWRHSEYLLEVIAGWFPEDPREPVHRDWMTGAVARLPPLVRRRRVHQPRRPRRGARAGALGVRRRRVGAARRRQDRPGPRRRVPLDAAHRPATDGGRLSGCRTPGPPDRRGGCRHRRCAGRSWTLTGGGSPHAWSQPSWPPARCSPSRRP